jgi:hypothetical protein
VDVRWAMPADLKSFVNIRKGFAGGFLAHEPERAAKQRSK